MSIPDLAILENYVLTLDCGHGEHHMEQCLVTKIVDKSGREHESIGWLSPQAAVLGAYDDAKSSGEKRMWWGKVLRGMMR
jgi:hypothetical protein